jgi:arsenate reductase (glutaredoxin)
VGFGSNEHGGGVAPAPCPHSCTMQSTVTIYHNPRCTKSRATLALLQERGLTPTVIEYLQTPPSAAQLRAVVRKLAIEPETLVRKGEEIFKAQYAGKSLTDAQWIEAMVQHPILIERPIVVVGDRAAIGRPPENVLGILPK